MFKISFSTAVKYKGDYYLSAQNVSGLFKYSEKKKELSYLMPLMDAGQFHHQFIASFIYNKEAWFIPCLADKIAIVNLEELSVRYLNIVYKSEFGTAHIKFINYCIFEGHYVCLVPQDIDAVNIIDLETCEVTAYYDVATVANNYRGCLYAGGKLHIYPWKGNRELVVNWHTGEKEFWVWDEGDYSYGDVYYDEKQGMAVHAPVLSGSILVERFSEKEDIKIAVNNTNNAKTDEYLTYYISKTENGEILIWGMEKADVIGINLQDVSYFIYKVKEKETNETMVPIHSDDDSDGSEAIQCGGSKIVRQVVGEMQSIDIPALDPDIRMRLAEYAKRSLAKSAQTRRDLDARPENGTYWENWLFGIDEYIEFVKLA